MYVDDLVRGLVAMMENDKSFVGPVNMGNPVEVSMLDLARCVLRMIPESTSQVVFKELPADDPRRRCPDISLARKMLGWSPQVPLETGLAKMIDYFRAQMAAGH